MKHITSRQQKVFFLFFVLWLITPQGNAQQKISLNKEYKDIALSTTADLSYSVALKKGGVFRFSILQQGIAVHYTLSSPGGEKLYESDYPSDISGYERFEYTASNSGDYRLAIKRFADPENTDSGRITLCIKSLTGAEIALKEKIRKELEPENKKNITTIDIDHFWEAYDRLSNCKSFSDSAQSFQKIYLDRATDGLLDFIQVRDLTAERFVEAVSKHAAFYKAIRSNTCKAKNAEPVVEEVFSKFREIYSDFKPFKVCFAIGINNTGGTVSNRFVLIGTEVTTSMGSSDSAKTEDIVQKIKGIVAHECVHTQQKSSIDSGAIRCPLLNQSIREGSCDFIGELITGIPYKNEYGEKNEGRLWTDFKNELCNQNIGNWLYNGGVSKDRPGDLGYFIGHQIAKAYYTKSTNKKQAIVDIIGMSDPLRFLQLSGYDQTPKK